MNFIKLIAIKKEDVTQLLKGFTLFTFLDPGYNNPGNTEHG